MVHVEVRELQPGLGEPYNALARARLRGLERLPAGGDECVQDLGVGSLSVSYFNMSGGSWELQVLRGGKTRWVRLNNLARARNRGLDMLEAGSDNFVNASYFTVAGSS